VFIYTNLLTASFFLSAFFYWFLVLLFIFFFCLLGIFLSICTTNPNRSLVYCLLAWIMLCIILPISWDYIASPKLFDDEMVQLRRVHADKQRQVQRVLQEVPDEMNLHMTTHLMWNSGHGIYQERVWTFTEAYQRRYLFLRYVYENYFPASREVEQAMDEIQRKRIGIDNIKSLVFFFNPIVLFNDIGARIAGNSRADYLRFLHAGREIRDDLVNLGIREGWLFDYRFFAYYADENQPGSWEPWGERAAVEGWDTVWVDIQAVMGRLERFSFDMPFIRRYEQPNPTFGEIFSRIAVVLVMFVVSILILWICTWYKFMRYDVR